MKKKVLKYLFWAVVAAVLVYFCVRSIDWALFMEALGECRWIWVLVSMLMGVLVQVFRALRWQMLLRPLDPTVSFITCFNAYNICMVVNLAVPRAGELARMGYVAKDSSAGADKTLGTIVVERLWDVIFLLLAGGLMLLLGWETFGLFITEAFSAGSAGSGILWLVGGFTAALLLLVLLSWRLRTRGKFWAKVWGFVEGIGHGLVSFRQMKKGWLFILYTFAIWALYWLMSAAIIWALQDLPAFADLGLVDALFISIVGSLSSMVPVPGGFGAYHGMVAGALTILWNMPIETAMVYAVLNHESQVLTQAVYGLASYIHESFIRRP